MDLVHQQLEIFIPDWVQVWFCIFPTVETLSFQALAVIYELGSYFLQRYLTMRKAIKQKNDSNNVSLISG